MKNILVCTYWSYKDSLIQTYTLPYVRMIQDNLESDDKIYLFTIEQDFYKMSVEEWKSEKQKLAKENIILLRFRYSHFGLKMILNFILIFLRLITLIFSENISHIHAWCTPGGAIGYILSVLTFRPLIIDSYEPHAESMVENGEWQQNSKAFKILFRLEKKMSRRAKTVIALTEGMRNYASEKYHAQFEKYYVKPALVDFNKFNLRAEKNQSLVTELNLKDDNIVCLYAGKLGGIYLENEVYDLIAEMYRFWGNRFRMLFCTNADINVLNQALQSREVPQECVIAQFVSHDRIAEYFKLADFAINPVKPVPSKRYCTSIKDGEYWAMGLPVIITQGISDDSDIIENENIGTVISSLSDDAYREAIVNIDRLLQTDKEILRNKINTIARKYRSFSIAEGIYQKIYG